MGDLQLTMLVYQTVILAGGNEGWKRGGNDETIIWDIWGPPAWGNFWISQIHQGWPVRGPPVKLQKRLLAIFFVQIALLICLRAFFSPQNCWWLNCLLGRKLACKFHEKNHRGDKRRDRQSTRETIPLSFPRSFPLFVRSNQQVHPDLYRNELHAMSTMAMIFFLGMKSRCGGDQGCEFSFEMAAL